MSSKQRRHFVCEACGLENLTELDYCLACKTPMREAGSFQVSAKQPVATPPPSQQISCPKCSARLEPGWDFCDQCGCQLSTVKSGALRSVDPLASSRQPQRQPRQEQPAVKTQLQPSREKKVPIAGQSTDLNPQQLPAGQQKDEATAEKLVSTISGAMADNPVPQDAKGLNFAGAVPFGLFAFSNGLKGLGWLGLLGTISPLGPVYFLIMLLKGREMAWKNRVFDSVEKFRSTMRVWNSCGVICFVGIVLLVIIVSLAAEVIYQVISKAVDDSVGGLFDGLTQMVDN